MEYSLFTPINLVLIGLWSMSAFLAYADYCYIWQLKEYRLDRMRDFFSTKQGRAFWFNYAFLLRALCVLVVAFWPINSIGALKMVIGSVLIVDLFNHLYCFWQKTARYPRPTPKALLLLLTAFTLEAGLLFWQRDWNLVFLLMLTRFFIMSGVVFVWNHITGRIKDIIIYQATRKITRQTHLTVIGITGSYGKSSVKEFTSQILARQFTVIKTPGNINTDIGVAQFILRTDFSRATIFVCEMGAYRIGEINKICQIVKPKVGILTSIIEQHLSLFGSLKNIQTAKYELLRAIPTNGLIITNANNEYCTEYLGELTCQKQCLFGEEVDNQPDYLIDEVDSGSDGVQWNLVSDSVTQTLSAPLRGPHQPLNVTPALIVANFLGMSWVDINAQAKLLKPGPNALSIYKYKQATIIDDTYNSNPKGFKAALDILASFSSKVPRIVVTRGMLELAEKSAEYHATIGEEIAFCANELVIISPDSADDFMRGVNALKNKYPLEVRTIFEPVKLLEYLKTKAEEPVVILLENRQPALVMNEIKALV